MRRTRLAPLALLALAPLAARGDDVTTSGGKKLSGKVVAVDEQGVTLLAGSDRAVVAARDIVVVDLGNKVAPVPKNVSTFAEIELTDGSTFRVAKFALKGRNFTADLLPGPDGVPPPQLDLPMSAVFSAMKRADDPKVRDNWKRMLGTRGKRDLYVIAQENGFTYIQGTVTGGKADERGRPLVSFERDDGGKDDLLVSRSAGLVLYQPQAAKVPPTLCKVQDVFGNALTAAAVAFAPDGLTVTTVSGVKVRYASSAALVRLDYGLGNVAYLSDLDPQLDVPEVPPEERNLNQPRAVIKDRSFSNLPLRLDGQLLPKGVCIAPETIATYSLNGDYTQFKATVGIDENGAAEFAAARVVVEADGQVVFSEVVTRKDKPKGLVLSIKGVKQLRIAVEADGLPNGNYVVLGEARVQK